MEVMQLIIYVLLLIIVIKIVKKIFFSATVKEKLRQLEKNNKVTITTGDELLLKNVDYTREIPFNKDKYYVYYVTTVIKESNPKQNLLINFIKACLVDLIQMDILELKREHGTIELIIKDEKVVNLKEVKDIELVKILQSIATNHAIRKESFKKLAKKDTDAIILWCTNAFQEAEKVWYHKTPEERHKDIAIVKGLERFLLEYSKIEEKSTEEVKIWEEYLTFAMILMIADNTVEELDEIIPNKFLIKMLFQSRELVLQLFSKAIHKKEEENHEQ